MEGVNIHNHTILTKLKVGQSAWDQQFAWVRGYILALEDVIKDVAEYRARVIMGRELDDPYQVAFGIQDMVTKTLTQARATLATLERMEKEAVTTWKQFSGGLEPEGTEDEAVAGNLWGSAPASGPPEASDPEDQGRVPDPGAV